MAGLGIALFTDEHVYANLARALRQRGDDAVSCQEAGLVSRRVADDAQLVYAAEHGRAILTYDVIDFIQLDHRWRAQGRQHAGIIAVPSSVNSFGQLLRRVIAHLESTCPETQYDTLLWLP